MVSFLAASKWQIFVFASCLYIDTTAKREEPQQMPERQSVLTSNMFMILVVN
jgi:hypothetical protein